MADKYKRARRKQIDDKDLNRVMDRIAKNVRQARVSSELSQQVLATNAGIATTTLSDIERGQAFNLKLSTLIAIARQLKIKDFTELF
jgi:transcriptional regulator with XRE-family HTH domain